MQGNSVPIDIRQADAAQTAAKQGIFDQGVPLVARKMASYTVAFLMLGGGSLILILVLLVLRSPAFIMNDGVRCLLQQAATSTLFFVLVLSYPHFVFSYKFAFQQGAGFILRHKWPLLIYPLSFLSFLGLCLLTWNVPLVQVPCLLEMNQCLASLGMNLNLSSYPGCGHILLAALLVMQIIMSGHHFCFQAFGVAVACGQEAGYVLSAQQKRILRANMYALWFMNLLSGYTFFAMINTGSFAYHPARFPEWLCVASYLVFAASIVLLFTHIIIPVYQDKKSLPPLLAVLPVVSVWVWLQPFCQPFGCQGWVVPIAHGAQYLYFAYRVEGAGFDPLVAKQVKRHRLLPPLYLCLLTVLLIAAGYMAFIGVPLAVDHTGVARSISPTFFFLTAYLFLSTHHYMIDTVLWKNDSRAKQMLGTIQA